MFETAIKAAVVTVGIVGVWLLVQAAWRRMFAGDAERAASCTGWNCHACQDHTPCETALPEQDSDQSKPDQPGGERDATTGL